MNKAVLWIVVIAALGLLAFVFWGGREGEDVDVDTESQEETEVTEGVDNVGSEEDVPEEVDEAVVRERLEGATIIVPDLEVEATLEEGEATFDAGGIVPTDGFAILGESFAVENVASQRYVLAHLSINAGGSGVFDYLVSFRDTGSELEQIDAVLLGDRIVVEAVRTNGPTDNGVAIVADILVRNEGEALAVTPTVEQEVELVLSAGGELEVL